MDLNIVMAIYFVVVAVIMALVLINGKKNKKYYENLDKKEHPLKFLYPSAVFIYGKYLKKTAKRPNAAVVSKIKRIYVKENVGEETFLYMVKKISTIMGILLAACILGLMLCIANQSIEYVNSLERNDPGKGNASYELEVDYEGNKETVQIDIDDVKHTKEEILEMFDSSFEAVKKEVLAENPDAEHVTKPLNLITEYGEFDILWEIEDTGIINYNGEISDDVKGQDQVLLNLYATFSLDDVTKTYSIPVLVSAADKTDTEVLVEKILTSIEENNSIYEKNVSLPEEIDGSRVVFNTVTEHNEYVFLILAIVAVIVIAFGYDKTLDKQLKKRNEEMLLDFSEIVSKLSLLYEAGLSIYKAWERTVEDYETRHGKNEHFAYREMRMTLEKIKSGISERQAYAEFGKRCGLHPYIKLGNILEQNLTKGTKGMKALLKQEVDESFEERKRIAKKRGEEAGTKLIVPMIIMLVVVIIIIAVPAIMGMQL